LKTTEICGYQELIHLKSNSPEPQDRKAAERLFMHHRVERASRWMGKIALLILIGALAVSAVAVFKYDERPMWLRSQ
jgi:hypothetical protein